MTWCYKCRTETDDNHEGDCLECGFSRPNSKSEIRRLDVQTGRKPDNEPEAKE